MAQMPLRTKHKTPYSWRLLAWKRLPHNWPFVKGIHWSLTNSPQKGLVMRRLDISFVVSLSTVSNNQSVRIWFGTPSRSCAVTAILIIVCPKSEQLGPIHWNHGMMVSFITKLITPLMKLVHYNDVIMSAMASQITSLTIVYPTFYSGVDQRKHQSSASLAFVRGIHRWPVNSPHKGAVTRRIFPFDDVIMYCGCIGDDNSKTFSAMDTSENLLISRILKHI